MSSTALGTYAPNTWCPGCGNFAILNGMKTVLKDLTGGALPPENVVIVSGIGCHGKIVDYLDVNSFYALHGRAVPVAEGIKIANPALKVICFCGDGDAYGEGLEHLVFAAKRNVDITVVVHNNRVYSLTAFQYSPTSPTGFKGRSTPLGSIEAPINPLELMLAAGASFLGRGTSRGMAQLVRLFRDAILHKGFALVDVLQVCATFNNLYEYYAQKVYDLQDHDPGDRAAALARIREWDYNSDARIALGTLYRRESATFDEAFPPSLFESRTNDENIKDFLSRNR